MATTRARGTLGEDFAVERLRAEGYKILARNFRNAHAEIDIIAQRDYIVAFIEVKTRAETGYAAPAQAVSTAQRRRIVLAAAAYLRARGIYNMEAVQPRFDIFEVVTDRPDSPKVTRFSHLEGAFDTGGLGVSF